MSWQSKRLEQIAYTAGRIGWKGLTAKEYTNDGPYFLSVHSLNHGDFVDFSQAFHISEARYLESPEIMIEVDDILICKDGAGIGKLGIVNKIPGPTTINSSLLLIRASNEIDPKYLYYKFCSPSFQKIVQERIEGATTPHLYQREIKQFLIEYPDLEEQKRIVTILDQAFADIEKARANAEQNLKNARELFESYLQQVSTEKKSLGEYVSIKTGKLDSNAAVVGGEYPFFTCSRVASTIDTYAFDHEAILLAGNNASGDFNVKHYSGKFNAYQRTYVISIDDVNKLSYRFLYFQMLKSLKELKASSVGAGTKFLKIGMIKDLKISVPPLRVQENTLAVLESLTASVEKLENIYSEKLNKFDDLKKSILQKAFTGELTKQKTSEENAA